MNTIDKYLQAKQYLQISTNQSSDSHQYKIRTENKLTMSFPIIITYNTANTIIKIVDYEKLFREQPSIRKTLVDILSKSESMSSLSELSTEDQNSLFDVVDKFEEKNLCDYGADISLIGEDGIKELIDRDVVLITKLRDDIVSEGMIKVLTK